MLVLELTTRSKLCLKKHCVLNKLLNVKMYKSYQYSGGTKIVSEFILQLESLFWNFLVLLLGQWLANKDTEMIQLVVLPPMEMENDDSEIVPNKI